MYRRRRFEAIASNGSVSPLKTGRILVLAENQRNGFEVAAAMRRRRTEITIETSRRFVVSEFRGSLTSWCDECLAEVRMITANECAARLGVSSRTVYRWIELGQLHFNERFGVLLVCEVSLHDRPVGNEAREFVPMMRRGKTT